MEPASLPITILESNGSSNSSTAFSNASSRVASEIDPLLPELHDLVFQRRAVLIGRPGWLHLVTRNAGGANNLSSLWGKVPEPWEEEEWLELDASGYARKAVKRLLNDELQPLQNSVLVNSSWWNLTLGAERPAEETGPFDPNYGFYDLALRLTRQGHSLSKGTIYKECWYQGEQYSVGDGVYKYEAVFNPDKHSLRWLKTWRVSPGPLALVESKEILVEERADKPPAEILALLEGSRKISLR